MSNLWTPLPIEDGGTSGTTPASARRALRLGALATGNTAADITFTPAGASAVVRSVQSKEREIVSVTDFYANGVSGVAVDPTGVVDSTGGINAWLAVGGRLYAPKGTFKYTAALTPVSNSEIYGDGDSTAFQGGANCKGFSLNGLSNVVLRDFKIDGKRATFTTTSNDAIFVNWVSVAGSNVDINRVTVVDPAGVGIIALAAVGTPSSGLIIDSCNVHDTGAHGIISQDYISDVQITNNKVKNSGLLVSDRPCITASRNGSNVIVSDNVVVGSGSALGTSVHGISIDTTTNATVQGNVVSGNKGYGIEVGFVTNGSVTGNTIVTPNSGGIVLSGVESSSSRNTNVSVTGNNISSSSGSGIYAFMTGATGVFFHQNIAISGNVVNGSTQRGMDLEFIDKLSVTGNSVYNCTQSGIYILDCKNHFTDGNAVVNNNCGTIHNVTSITLAAGTATVTDTAHGYATSDVITIFGANPADYNGAVVITNTGANTYTYAATAGLTTPAVGTIQATKSPSQAEAGIRVVYSAVTSKPHYAFGTNFVYGNGYREYYDVSLNGVVGLFNDVMIFKKGVDPRVENLTSGESANIRDRAGLYMKNNKIVIAYDNAGTTNFLSCALDGSTVTWVNSATAP